MCGLNKLISPVSHFINDPEVTQSAWERALFIVEEREGGEAEKQVSPLYIHFKDGQMKVSRHKRTWEPREATGKPGSGF